MEHTEAAADLRDIREIMERTRRSFADGGVGPIMIVWGVTWLLGFTGTQFLSGEAKGWVWLVLHVLAISSTIVISKRAAKGVRSDIGGRIFSFWIALVVYSALWAWILRPTAGVDAGLFIATVAMFGWVVLGLWLSSHLFIGVGISVTILAVVGYLLLPAFFALWMALLGGGTLIGSGVYVRRCWR